MIVYFENKEKKIERMRGVCKMKEQKKKDPKTKGPLSPTPYADNEAAAAALTGAERAGVVSLTIKLPWLSLAKIAFH